MDEAGIIELVERIRKALLEKKRAAIGLKDAWRRDIEANKELSEVKTALREVQFEQLGHITKIDQ